MTESQKRSVLSMPANGRGLIVGTTGSGKSTLSRALVSDKLNLVVIDPRRDFQPMQEYLVCQTPEDLSRHSKHLSRQGSPEIALVYRPGVDQMETEAINLVFKWIFERQRTFCYIDEVTLVAGGALSFPKYLRALYMQGRAIGIGVLAATQRPANIPGFMFTESEQYWKFFLSNVVDQQRMATYMGKSVLEPDDYPESQAHSEHSFYYFQQGQRTSAEEFTLEL